MENVEVWYIKYCMMLFTLGEVNKFDYSCRPRVPLCGRKLPALKLESYY